MHGYTYLWEFEVRPGHEAEFEQHYGPGGTWVELFRTAPGYLDTTLLRALSHPHRYVTVDRWESETAFQAFRTRQAEAFERLDARCANLTISEREIGQYEVVTSYPQPTTTRTTDG